MARIFVKLMDHVRSVTRDLSNLRDETEDLDRLDE